MYKIQAAEGNWVDKRYFDLVLPKLTERSVPIVRQDTLPLTEMANSMYWDGLRLTQPLALAYLDNKHWYFDDRTFHEYLKRVASVWLPALCLADMPYSVPVGMEPDVFESKLYQRTKETYEVLKKLSPGTLIISPPIGITSVDFRERYLDYFIHNRSYFDAWGMVAVYDMKEQISALLTALFTQVIQVLYKPVFVVKWSVPSCDHPIESRFTLQSSTWSPTKSKYAALQMSKTFQTIEEICRNDSFWFFTGVGGDEYKADAAPPDYWSANRLYALTESSWGYQHFLGMLDYQGNIKEEVLEMLAGMCQKYNG